MPLLKSILLPKLLKMINASFNFDLKFMNAHTKITIFVRTGYNSLLKIILCYSFTTKNNRPHYQNHNFCKTFRRLVTKINTFACPTTLKSQLLQEIHTLLSKIKLFIPSPPNQVSRWPKVGEVKTTNRPRSRQLQLLHLYLSLGTRASCIFCIKSRSLQLY